MNFAIRVVVLEYWWERTAEIISQQGYPVTMGKEIVSIQHNGNRVTGIVTRDVDGSTDLVCGTHYISTLPMRELVYAFLPYPPLPSSVRQAADRLKYRDFLTGGVDRRQGRDVP